MVLGLFGKKDGPPDDAAVHRRTLVLRHVVAAAFSGPPPDAVDKLPEETRKELSDQLRGEAGEREKALRDAGLWNEVTAEEKAFVRAGPLAAPRQLLLNAVWATESSACLVWALGLAEELPPWDDACDPGEFLDLLPDDPGGLVLRDRAEIKARREVAELWHWRCRTRRLQEEGKLDEPIRGEMMIDDVIRMTAEHAAGAGEIPPTIDGDFPARGKAFRDLDEDDFSIVTSIAMERHKALNWLCGYAPKNRWDEVPTDT